MERPYLKIKLLRDDATMPSKRDEDAGYDLYCAWEEDFFVFNVGDLKLFPTKLSLEFPQDWVFYIAERGSTGTKGISRRCGVIDSGFRGELFVALNNTSNKPIVFYSEEGEKLDEFLKSKNLEKENITLYPQSKAIAQGMLLYCPHVDVEQVHDLTDSQRGDGALGSSNK